MRSEDFARHAPRITRTSGSTGEPFTIYHSGLSHTYLRALNFAAWNQAGYKPGDRYATFSGGSLMPDSIGFKQIVYSCLLNSRPLPSYHLSREHFIRYLSILQRERVEYVYGYASALHDFAKTIEAQGLDFSFLRGVFTSSDMLYPPQRQAIERVLGVKIIDIYGNPESGLMSYECSQHDGFHQGMQNAFVEIVDADGQPVPDGMVGRVIVTSLNNRCFPIVRYDTGDEAAITREDCPCGRGLIKIRQLGGRSRDYIVLPDGRHIHGAFFNHLTSIYHAPWLDRYHINQRAPDLLEFQCLVSRKPAPAELEAIAAEIRTGTSGLLQVDVKVVDEMPMTRRGKYKLITRSFESEAE
jgi:phenylacetate-CoA ligase